MTGFSYEVRDLGENKLELVLSGYMNEMTKLPDVKKFTNCRHLIINFKMIKSVLSIGIKHWINFADRLETIPNLSVEFHNCPKLVIDQVNLIKGFLPENGQIKSLFIPIFCDNCNRTFNVLKNTEGIKVQLNEIINDLGDVDCDSFPTCKKHFDLEVQPETYLKFLKPKTST